jgi:hypothetical protein
LVAERQRQLFGERPIGGDGSADGRSAMVGAGAQRFSA